MNCRQRLFYVAHGRYRVKRDMIKTLSKMMGFQFEEYTYPAYPVYRRWLKLKGL